MSSPPDPRVRFRRRTAKGWLEINPTLKRGEPGYETDTGKVKVGDGVTRWDTLAYVGDALLGDLVERVSLLEEGGGGSAGGGLQKVEVTLDQAQIQNLVVTPHVLIPATETPNYGEAHSLPVVIAARWAIKLGVTPYAGLHPTGGNSLLLCWGSDFSMGFGFIEKSTTDFTTKVYSNQEADVRTDIFAWTKKRLNGNFFLQTAPNPPAVGDNALGVVINRPFGGPSGPLTGGNDTDWMKISIWYDIIDLT